MTGIADEPVSLGLFGNFEGSSMILYKLLDNLKMYKNNVRTDKRRPSGQFSVN